MALPTASSVYILERIGEALRDAEYARLIGDTDRSTQAMKESVLLARALSRFVRARAQGGPLVVEHLGEH